MTNSDKSNQMANAIRFLSADAVEKANSGHPGLPMGAADIATVLHTRFLKHDPKAPHWPDRDRSFTAAADRLGVAKAVVSHQVSKLEEELGTALLIRTTRRLRTTEAGRRFYERCIVVLREAENAIEEVSSETGTPVGTLMLTAPLDYGAKVVAPALALYLQCHPQMQADLTFTDVKFDLVDNELDLSIRVGWLEDSSAQARRIGTFEQHLVCSPAYAGQIGRVAHPCALEAAKWIANGALKEPLRWLFAKGDEKVVVTGKSVVSANGTEASYVCVLA